MTTFTTEDRLNAEPIPFAGMVELPVEQGTEEWKQLRLGKVTASRVADVLSKIKSGESAGRKNYRMDLVVERLTGIPTASYSTPAMDWGKDNEPWARMAYEAHSGVFVDQIAFIDHPTIKWFGCSPDGLIGSEGNLEIKCPNTATHIEYLLAGVPPAKYIPQMQTQMACSGRLWTDFVSYDPRLPDDLQLFVVRLDRDETYIKAMEEEVVKFLDEVEDTCRKLKARK